MRQTLKVATALLMASTVSGCGYWKQEFNNRGGYADYVADKYWMSADTKLMRVLRAYVIQSALVRLAANSPRGVKDRYIVVARMQQANLAFTNTFTCALNDQTYIDNPEEGKKNKILRCIFFDDLIVAWSNDLLALALASLSIEDGQSFIGNITGGGLDTLQALFELGRDGFILNRQVGALYRDTIELEVLVWLDDPTLENKTAALRAAYADGAGSLASWKAQLDILKGRPVPQPEMKLAIGTKSLLPKSNPDSIIAGTNPAPQGYPTPNMEHFIQIQQFIERSCGELVSETELIASCASVDNTTMEKMGLKRAGEAAASQNAANTALANTVKEVAPAAQPGNP